jgi:hypothetical protein
MQFKIPKNTKEFYWTEHSIFKMRYYALSAQKILHVIKKPERKEEGIVKNTIAVMQPVNPKILKGKKIWKQEIWAMYQARRAGNPNDQISKPKQIKNSKLKNCQLPTTNYKLKIISVWRYPGVSPQKDPIPSDILAEIESVI